MRYLPAIIIAVALLLTPPVWFLSQSLLAPSSGGGDGAGGGPRGLLVDDDARLDIDRMSRQIAFLQERIEKLELRTLGQVTAPLPDVAEPEETDDTQVTGILTQEENTIRDDYPKVVNIEERRKINQGLTVPPRSYLIEVLGRPRESLSDKCESITNPAFAARITTEQVGQIRVRMVKPAVESMKRIFELIRRVDQDLYDRIRSSGALCVRRIRGTQNTISSHSFGLAIDLNIDGQLDQLGDGKTQLGLTIISEIFQNEGWIWGAGFGREDSMHFEVSKELLDQWRVQGKL